MPEEYEDDMVCDIYTQLCEYDITQCWWTPLSSTAIQSAVFVFFDAVHIYHVHCSIVTLIVEHFIQCIKLFMLFYHAIDTI
jgi:hypothetical protein